MGYPNNRNSAAGAIPVYIVAPPTPDSQGRFPNFQNNPNAAIPVNFVAAPMTPNAGAIPVRIVAGPGSGPKFPNDQGVDTGAIPVYDSGSLKAMLVWQVGGLPAPGPIPVNTTPPSITPTDLVQSGTLLTANQGAWDNAPVAYNFQWTRNGANINNATAPEYTTVLADRGANVGVIVSALNDVGISAPVSSSNVVHVENIPVNIILPVISPAGPVPVGTGLAVTNGNWTNNPTGYYYGWRRDGVGIVGASMNLYLTIADDANTIIDCVILAINSAGPGFAVETTNQVTVTP